MHIFVCVRVYCAYLDVGVSIYLCVPMKYMQTRICCLANAHSFLKELAEECQICYL